MLDLMTSYLGMRLRSPLIASASPLSKSVDQVRRMEEAGAGAVVMYSLFEEQISHEILALDYYLNVGADSYAESMSYFPELTSYNMGPGPYLEHLAQLKTTVRIPVIGSLNGVSSGGWIEYAKKIQDAGADALELNIYYVPADPTISGAELEENYVKLVRDVCDEITIPVAVKLSPFFSSLPHIAARFVEAGAAGLVLFNRFYQPDFDLEALDVVPHVELSSPHDLLLPLRWIAILCGRVPADLALTSGVHGPTDAIKAMMAGANAVMMASELLAHGIERLGEILMGIRIWMEEHEYSSVRQMCGSMSQLAVAEPAAFERAQYLKMLSSFTPHP